MPQGHMVLKPGTGGKYHQPGKSEALKPGKMLGSLLNMVPELKAFASLDLRVAFNMGGRLGMELQMQEAAAFVVPRARLSVAALGPAMVPSPPLACVQTAATWGPSSGCSWRASWMPTETITTLF